MAVPAVVNAAQAAAVPAPDAAGRPEVAAVVVAAETTTTVAPRTSPAAPADVVVVAAVAATGTPLSSGAWGLAP